MRLLPILLGVFLLLATGCESRRDVINRQREINLPKSTMVRSATAPVSLTMTAADAVLEEKGERLIVSLELVNHDDAPLNMTFTSSKIFDVLVRDPRGKPLMRWSDNRAFSQSMQDITLQPGESLRREMILQFPARLDSPTEGTYTVTGMTTGGVPLTTEPLVVRYDARRATRVPEDREARAAGML